MLFVQFKLALNQLAESDGLFVLTKDEQGYNDMLKFLSISERVYRHARLSQQSEMSTTLQQTLSNLENFNVGCLTMDRPIVDDLKIGRSLVDENVWMIEVLAC